MKNVTLKFNLTIQDIQAELLCSPDLLSPDYYNKAKRERPKSGPSENKIANDTLERALRLGKEPPKRTTNQKAAAANMITNLFALWLYIQVKELSMPQQQDLFTGMQVHNT